MQKSFSVRLTILVRTRNASEEVILELIRSKCIPVLIYGLECFALTKIDLKSLDFAVNRFLTKIFRSNNYEIIVGMSIPLLSI